LQRVERSIRVSASASKVYELWRNFERFPTFMNSVHEVTSLGDGRQSHWKITGPLGKEVEFDAEISEDEPNRSIGWRSMEGQGDIGVSGNATFSEVGEGETLVHVVMQWFDTPGGAIGEAVSRTLQNPEKMLEEDLHRFKDVAEGRMPQAA